MDAKGYLRTAAKLFAHGILFSLLTTIFSVVILLTLFGWVVLGVFLGGIIGFVLALIVLFILLSIGYGYANSVITRALWFQVQHGLGVYFGQGVLLFVLLLLVVSVPILLITLALAAAGDAALVTLPVQLVLTVAFSFVTGWVGRWVAGRWRSGPRWHDVAEYKPLPNPLLTLEAKNPNTRHCPRCGRTRLVVASDGSAFCIDCQKGIYST